MSEQQKKENAKRQALYRRRRLKEGTDQRLNVILDLSAKQALERMAQYAGVSNKDLLEQLLLKAQTELIAVMDEGQKVRYQSDAAITVMPESK